MVFKELQLSDQGIFEQLLSSNGYSLSSYHFGNIFVWKGLFRIVYAVIKGRICLFFQDKHTCFMYLPPLGGEPDISILEACFTIMDKFNLNKNISRIENVQKDSLCFYRRLGYDTRLKSPDYLYLREDISALRGNKLKSKRASYNYFNKKYDFELRPFCKEDAPGCLLLHKQWVSRRRQKVDDPAYRWMLGDSFSSHKLAMDNFRKLGLIGYVLKSKKEVIGYTFGFKLNPDTFCIMLEVCDSGCKGSSEFIFSGFCSRLSGYKYINTMDDCGLPNLRKSKLSYRPLAEVSNYIIQRKQEA